MSDGFGPHSIPPLGRDIVIRDHLGVLLDVQLMQPWDSDNDVISAFACTALVNQHEDYGTWYVTIHWEDPDQTTTLVTMDMCRDE